MIYPAHIPVKFTSVADALAAIAACGDTSDLSQVYGKLPKRMRDGGSVKVAYEAKRDHFRATAHLLPTLDTLWSDEPVCPFHSSGNQGACNFCEDQ